MSTRSSLRGAAAAAAALVILAGCSGAASAPAGGARAPAVPESAAAQPAIARTIEMHRSPTCSCCKEWAAVLRTAGWTVTSVEEADMEAFKRSHGVPASAESCHTSLVGGYVVEGHVPAAALERLLTARPAVDGLAVPGMPPQAPGMSGTPGFVSVMSIVDGEVHAFGVY